MKLHCTNCGSENLVIMTTMIVEMPAEYFYNLSKKKMRSKDFVLWGVNWNTSSFICKDCRYTLKFGEE